MPRVSVIIPTYNREKFVTKAVESALAQTYMDYEVIVVDDGSNDNTRVMLEKFGDKVKYFYQDNSGVSAARNTGIKLAKGEWLAFLDSDDEWKTDYLHKQMDRAQRTPGICMQTADCLFIGLNGDTERYFEMNGSLAEFHGQDYLFLEKPFRFVVKHGPWQIGSTIILRETVMKAGLFDTSLNLSEDFDLMARVASQGPFGMLREELVDVYRRDEPIACLTKQVEENHIQAREIIVRICENLKTIETLEYKERKALNEVVSANRRAIGNLLLKSGKIKEARDSYKRALFMSPSIASLGKYLLSFLGIETNVWVTEKNLTLRERRKQ